MSIIVDNISYIYEKGTGFERQALKNVSCAIENGEFIGLIGHTGSGKSTFIQHLNGLVKPTEGHIYYNGKDIYEPDFSMKELRSKVGLVFQYPEHQLFETEIFKDVCFGPKNLGLSQKEVEIRAFESLKLVGIDDNMFYQSPFELSGGQKRRVAIAGVLAMKPEVLILDEPTAGLDPKERISIRNYIAELSKDKIILFATHVVSDIECIADQVLLLKSGEIIASGTPVELIESMAGRVGEITCTLDEVGELQEKYKIGNIRQRKNGLALRVVGDELPKEAVKVGDNIDLEDVYLYYFE